MTTKTGIDLRYGTCIDQEQVERNQVQNPMNARHWFSQCSFVCLRRSTFSLWSLCSQYSGQLLLNKILNSLKRTASPKSLPCLHKGHLALGSALSKPSTNVTDAAEQAQLKQKICPHFRETGSKNVSRHMEQVKSMSNLTESRRVQDKDGFSPSKINEHWYKSETDVTPLLGFIKLMRKAISSFNQGDWRISICIACARVLNSLPFLE